MSYLPLTNKQAHDNKGQYNVFSLEFEVLAEWLREL